MFLLTCNVVVVVCVCVCMCVYVCVYMCACVWHVFVYNVCKDVFLYVQVHIHVLHVFMYVCVYMYVCMCSHNDIIILCLCYWNREESIWECMKHLKQDRLFSLCLHQQFYCNTDPQGTTSKHPTTANVILWHNTLR